MCCRQLLLTCLLLAFFQGTQEIREVSGTSFEALATETARKLDLVVADELSRTALLAINTNNRTTFDFVLSFFTIGIGKFKYISRRAFLLTS